MLIKQLDVTATQYLLRLFLEEYWHILIRWCLPVDRRSLWAAFWISYIQASKEQLVHYSFYGGGIDGELSACRQWSVCMDALSMYRLCRNLYLSCSDVCITVQKSFYFKSGPWNMCSLFKFVLSVFSDWRFSSSNVYSLKNDHKNQGVFLKQSDVYYQ